jgi:flagellar assembly protein FliH
MSSSDRRRSGIIRGSEVTAKRWDMPEVDPNYRRPGSEEPVKVKPPTAAEVEAIRDEAEKEGYQAGYKKGQKDGFEQGLRDGQQDVEQAAQSLRQVVQDMADPLAVLDAQIEQDIVDLVATLAEQVLQRELDARPAALRKIVKESLNALPASEREGRIYVHPDDYDWLVDDQGVAVDGWQLLSDSALHRGGCRVESRHAKVDASFERRLQDAMARLFDREDEEHEAEKVATSDSSEVAADESPAADAQGA